MHAMLPFLVLKLCPPRVTSIHCQSTPLSEARQTISREAARLETRRPAQGPAPHLEGNQSLDKLLQEQGQFVAEAVHLELHACQPFRPHLRSTPHSRYITPAAHCPQNGFVLFCCQCSCQYWASHEHSHKQAPPQPLNTPPACGVRHTRASYSTWGLSGPMTFERSAGELTS